MPPVHTISHLYDICQAILVTLRDSHVSVFNKIRNITLLVGEHILVLVLVLALVNHIDIAFGFEKRELRPPIDFTFFLVFFSSLARLLVPNRFLALCIKLRIIFHLNNIISLPETSCCG